MYIEYIVVLKKNTCVTGVQLKNFSITHNVNGILNKFELYGNKAVVYIIKNDFDRLGR